MQLLIQFMDRLAAELLEPKLGLMAHQLGRFTYRCRLLWNVQHLKKLRWLWRILQLRVRWPSATARGAAQLVSDAARHSHVLQRCRTCDCTAGVHTRTPAVAGNNLG